MNPEEPGILEAEALREKMLIAAEKSRATDIHLDPTEDNLLIRLRIDGVLHVWAKRPLLEHENLISHLKIFSGLDITRHSIPQEGHFTWSPPITNPEDANRGRIFNIRSSFFPTIYGESVALRLFNRADLFIKLDDLEFDDNGRETVRTLINRPYGLVLIVGPAGSGKTTTLYSLLSELANESKNIITLEDPVEYHLAHVRQSQIEPEHNYSFATGIRSILRQDPDVIMVGEIRDLDTAENAVRASLTGRLLLSTLHANHSVGAISRLIDMKIERDILAYALSGIIGRRLVRRVCTTCKVTYRPPDYVTKALGLETTEEFSHGTGCDQCNHTGLRGRIGLFEVLEIDEQLRRMIVDGALPSELLEAVRQKGFKTLREDGIAKIRAGLTTPEEVLRVIV